MTQGEDVSDEKAKNRILEWPQDYKPSTVSQKAQKNCHCPREDYKVFKIYLHGQLKEN